ncbi:MAG TPA: hypothetical protein VFG91_11335 [Woeseiaceae bacterium]|nr:hypothetical protein [Woeseiaceae bacterium]
MAKGNIATGLVLLLAASVTLAQPARAGDGCSLLESLVQESVYRAATEYKPALPQGKTGASLQGGTLAYRQACVQTVAVTTRAFTRAMADLGLSIGWYYPPNPGDYCLSHDLAQCYPGVVPGEPAIPPNQLGFVYDAWKGVQNAVISHMRQGSSSGASTFTAESLEASLWSSLQLTVEGPLYLGYSRY